MQRDLGDIIDRWSIAKLKAERIGSPENKREFEAFDQIISEYKKSGKMKWFEQYCELLLRINDFIWMHESGLKSGKEKLKNPIYLFDKENEESLARIGLATIEIRNYNSLRVDVKNLINRIAGEGFQDIKKNHLSQHNGKVHTPKKR